MSASYSETATADMDQIPAQSTNTATTGPLSLQSSLHAATRSLHMSLNRSITARLPLCLPPHVSNPTAYHTGMIMFGQIFLTFEAAMSDALKLPSCSVRDREVIERLRAPGLVRSAKLRHDFELLAKRSEAENERAGGYALLEGADAVRAAARDHTIHIRQNVTQKPYLAMAYAWTMYLALFNGGRWLHRMLAAAGPEFWLEEDSIAKEDARGSTSTRQNAENIEALSFWHFDPATEDDPEADKLKLEFKSRFDKASELLDETERNRVVQEATSIFEMCAKMVEFLDEYMEGQQGQETTGNGASISWLGPTAASVWQGLRSTLLSLGVPRLPESLRKAVDVVE